MTILQSIILGILQGIAEFLPISSSGHLAVFQNFLGLKEVPIFYDILLHVATLLVVLIYFRKIIIRLFAVFFRFIIGKKRKEDKNDLFMVLAVIIATIVTFSGYLVLKLFIDTDTMKENLILVFSLFIVTGFILLLQTFFHPKENSKITPLQALLVGLGQIAGLFPGISRSGSTISVAVMCGVDRKKAGEISFLISIPAIVGSILFMFDDLLDLYKNGDGVGDISFGAIGFGMVAAFGAGMVAFPLLLKMLQKDKLYLFSIYLIPLGVSGLIYQIFFI